MQDKVIIATKNKDKFVLVSDLLRRTGRFDGVEFLSLKDLDISEDFEEIGNVQERALKKAKDYAEVLRAKGLSDDVRCIIGVDDAMLVEKEGEIVVDSKTITDEILAGTRMTPGERLIVVRGYGMIDIETEEERTCETKVPFVFLGNEKGIIRKDGEYPLSRVLAYEGDTIPITERPWEVGMEYGWKYYREPLEKMFSK